MNKIRNVFYFFISIGIIILIYVLILNNILKLTLDYDNETFSYQNKYKVENKEERIKQYLDQIQTTSRYINDEISTMILENTTIQRMNKYLLNINEKELEKYIKDKTEKRVIAETKYGDIIYVKSKDYQLAFTNDLRNLYYSAETKILESEFELENLKDIPEEINKSKEEIIENINSQLIEMALQKNNEFKADSILIQQRHLIESNVTSYDKSYHYIYVVDDINKKIQVSYDLNNEKINKIIIGFE